MYINEIDLTTANAPDIMMVAHYYGLLTLEDLCSAFLKKTLCMKTVLYTFNKIHLLERSICTDCTRMLQLHMQVLLQDRTVRDNLFDLTVMALAAVFAGETMCIANEVVVFEALLRWGLRQLGDKEDKSRSKLRRKIGSRLNFIRFGHMTEAQFTQCLALAGEGLFTADDINDTFLQIRNEDYNVDNRKSSLTWYADARKFEMKNEAICQLPDYTDFKLFREKKIEIRVKSAFRLVGIKLLNSVANLVSVSLHDKSLPGFIFNDVPYTIHDKNIVFNQLIIKTHFCFKIVFNEDVKHYKYKKYNEGKSDTLAYCPEMVYLISKI